MARGALAGEPPAAHGALAGEPPGARLKAVCGPLSHFATRPLCHFLILFLFALLLPSCASGPTTSRLTADDLIEMTESMAASLRESDLLAERDEASPPMRIALMPAENLSSDLVPIGERWLISERIQDSAEMRALANQKNVSWLIPVEDVRRLRAQNEEMLLAATEREPTHVLRPVLRSVTRRADEARTDLYVVTAAIEELASGEAVWSADFLVKRAALGRAWD